MSGRAQLAKWQKAINEPSMKVEAELANMSHRNSSDKNCSTIEVKTR